MERGGTHGAERYKPGTAARRAQLPLTHPSAAACRAAPPLVHVWHTLPPLGGRRPLLQPCPGWASMRQRPRPAAWLLLLVAVCGRVVVCWAALRAVCPHNRRDACSVRQTRGVGPRDVVTACEPARLIANGLGPGRNKRLAFKLNGRRQRVLCMVSVVSKAPQPLSWLCLSRTNAAHFFDLTHAANELAGRCRGL